jgi:hypothetical protein
MQFQRLLPLTLLCAGTLFAQLTPEQKLVELQTMADVYARNYGPAEWKKAAFGYDMFNLAPWRDRALKTRDDVEFMELLVDWVASLNDAHDGVTFPSTFVARLNFGCDIYDGKVLVDSVSTLALPPSKYNIRVGDEVVSLDGQPINAVLDSLLKYSVAANPRSTRRQAAARIATRSGVIIPSAHLVGDLAAVELRHADGTLETLTIPWVKTGLPFTVVGPTQMPLLRHAPAAETAAAAEDDPLLEPHMLPLRGLLNVKLPRTDDSAVLGMGARAPIFALPADFQQRLGRLTSDVFYSGVFSAGGYKIGYIRIPDFEPSSTSTALRQFETEINYFNANTDGLIVDDMRNPGGSITYVEALAQRLTPYMFRTVGFEIRASQYWLLSFASALSTVKAYNYPDWIVANWQNNFDAMRDANARYNGRTPAISLNGTGSLTLLPWLDADWNVMAYKKPIMVLVDEFSASGADMFPAILQDNQRALIYGYRTMGAGGNVNPYETTPFTETIATLTESLMSRKAPVVTPEYPAAPYVENIGVRPDIVADYMTRDNLMNAGKSFVDGFSAAMVDWIRKNQ